MTILQYKGVFELAVVATNNVFRYHAGKKPIYSTECIKKGVASKIPLVLHSVLAVGYGKDPATGYDYVIIQNSFGPDWGDNGFGKISLLDDPATKNCAPQDGGDGICGICGITSEEHAFFVDIDKTNMINAEL